MSKKLSGSSLTTTRVVGLRTSKRQSTVNENQKNNAPQVALGQKIGEEPSELDWRINKLRVLVELEDK